MPKGESIAVEGRV